MITVPVTILDNFFENPYSIREWALSLKYEPHPFNQWPGGRTECLSKINSKFYNYVNQKVLSLFFENYIYLDYKGDLHFQMLDQYNGTGWIHQDPNVYTYIIYLTDNTNINCGTSLYKLKSTKYYPISNENEGLFEQNRLIHHKEKQMPDNVLQQKQEYDNFSYEKVLDIPDYFNRLLIFPAEHPHAANFLGDSNLSRLTLIGFVEDISTSKLPIVRSKKVNMGI